MPLVTDVHYMKFRVEEVYNGWLVNVLNAADDRLIARHVFITAEAMLEWLKEKLTNA